MVQDFLSIPSIFLFKTTNLSRRHCHERDFLQVTKFASSPKKSALVSRMHGFRGGTDTVTLSRICSASGPIVRNSLMLQHGHSERDLAPSVTWYCETFSRSTDHAADERAAHRTRCTLHLSPSVCGVSASSFIMKKTMEDRSILSQPWAVGCHSPFIDNVARSSLRLIQRFRRSPSRWWRP